MNIFQILYDEVIGFFGIGHVVEVVKSGDYSSLLTFDGILSVISPFIPFLLIIEIIRALVYKKFKIDDYRVPFFIFVANRFISRFISIAAVAIGAFGKVLKITWSLYAMPALLIA